MKSRHVVVWFLGILLLTLAPRTTAATRVRLLEVLSKMERGIGPAGIGLDRHAVRINPNAFDSDQLQIPLLDATVVAKRETLPAAVADTDTWSGRIVSEPASAVLLARDGEKIAGTIIRESGDAFRILTDPLGQQVLERFDNSRAVPEAPPARARPMPPPPAGPCTAAPFPVIDVLVLYTIPARQQAGGPNGIRSLIRLAALETNWSFFVSGISAGVRIAERRELGEDDSQQDGETMEDLRNRLQATGDGILDEAQQLREDFHADAVVLIVEDSDFSGIAYVMEQADESFGPFAYCVVQRLYATSNFTFTHELGHLMGARHEWSSDCTNGKPFAFNHAFVCLRPKRHRKPWRTVMATHEQCNRLKIDCQRILRWSDPAAKIFSGDRVGVGEPAPTDNHRALNETAALVSTFRCP